MLVALPLQQWLRERRSVLRITYVVCLVRYSFSYTEAAGLLFMRGFIWHLKRNVVIVRTINIREWISFFVLTALAVRSLSCRGIAFSVVSVISVMGAQTHVAQATKARSVAPVFAWRQYKACSASSFWRLGFWSGCFNFFLGKSCAHVLGALKAFKYFFVSARFVYSRKECLSGIGELVIVWWGGFVACLRLIHMPCYDHAVLKATSQRGMGMACVN
jgi:hypothetical protein